MLPPEEQILSGRTTSLALLCLTWRHDQVHRFTHGPAAGGTRRHTGGGGRVFVLRAAPDPRSGGPADKHGGPQPQGLTATAAHSERPQRTGHRHARHAVWRRALPSGSVEKAVRRPPRRSVRRVASGSATRPGRAGPEPATLFGRVAGPVQEFRRPLVRDGRTTPGTRRA